MPVPSLISPQPNVSLSAMGLGLESQGRKCYLLDEMYSFLDRKLLNLSIDTLFTPFGLQINKLGEEKRGKKWSVGDFLKLHLHNNFKSVLYGYIYILHSLIFPTVPKTPKTEFE